MEVRVKQKKFKNTDRIVIEVKPTDEEMDLLSNFHTNLIIPDIMQRIRDSSPLGTKICLYVEDYKELFENEDRTSDGVYVPHELITNSSLDNVAKAVASCLSEVLERAITIPEINEEVYEINGLPENVANELKRRGIDPTFKNTLLLSKEKGFNSIKIKSKTVACDKLVDLGSDLNSFSYTKDMLNVHYETAKVRLLGRWYENETGIEHVGGYDIVSINEYDDFRIKDYRGIIEEKVKQIKEAIIKEARRIENSNEFNLLVAAAYHPLSYNTTLQIEETEFSKLERYMPVTAKVSIERKWLLAPITVSIELEIDKRFSMGETRGLAIDIEGEGIKQTLRIEGREGWGWHTPIDDFPVLTSEEVIKSRFERLLSGDFSVIDEVEQQDQEVVKSIVEQLQSNPLYSISNRVRYNGAGLLGWREREKEQEEEEKNTKLKRAVSVNVYDLINEERRQELISYLVSKKLKNSVGV